MRCGLLLAVLSASALAASPLDERWPEQVLSLRKGTFEVGLGLGANVAPAVTVQPVVDPTSTLRLGVLDWLEVSLAWLRARVTPQSERAGVLLGAGTTSLWFSSSVGFELSPSVVVEGYARLGALIAVGRLSLGMPVGVANGLAYTGPPVAGAATTLLFRLTEGWVMLSTFSLRLRTSDWVALPWVLLRSRSYLTPAWAIDLWLSADEASFAPGLSVVFAPSGLF